MDIYRVEPGTQVNLQEWDPDDKSAFEGGKSEGQKAVEKLNRRLEGLQELLYAEGKHKLLIVLQAMDTGGKDGVIRHVFDGVNPQGVRVASFKAPTPEELAHDYLWRVHKHTPGKGEMVIFNRSHYEDVLVVRVHNLVPPEVWGRRYAHINDFERMLAEEGTTILKFFLHISKDEQKARLQARLDEPDKRWKFNIGDLGERALWDEYMRAYEVVLSETSTEWAPWYIVPSNRKWYRDLIISEVLVRTLENLNMRYPQPKENLDAVVIE
ncbi:MAG TPA: polyphosphate kinase 2 family protein [Anaerolineae bacterium]|nr:polyphosphate kinase 2 family protein [Anaerolineae bacterium]HQK14271.1 polyphosphate kinase 2 family protein [Anaerolineae bacterium]